MRLIPFQKCRHWSSDCKKVQIILILLDTYSEFSLIGLLLIAIGTGGIKPCVAAFGGDQFKMPEQERQLQSFFSVFYFAINAGALISTFITPIFRYF
jgi:dipeptide/tripeptide permease